MAYVEYNEDLYIQGDNPDSLRLWCDSDPPGSSGNTIYYRSPRKTLLWDNLKSIIYTLNPKKIAPFLITAHRPTKVQVISTLHVGPINRTHSYLFFLYLWGKCDTLRVINSLQLVRRILDRSFNISINQSIEKSNKNLTWNSRLRFMKWLTKNF